MTLPNFLIIGAAKSGTTSLYRYLQQHPEIYMKAKEPSFFALNGEPVQFNGPGDSAGFVRRMVTTFDAYEALFDEISTEKAYGEASVIYLYNEGAAARIQRHIPDVKLIAILRNPVDRAYSSYLHLRRDGRETLSFPQALAAEAERAANNWEHQWHYTRLGMYHTQLRRYYDRFPRENIAIFRFGDFKREPARVLGEIYEFLGVSGDFMPDMSVKYNVSGQPKLKALHQFLIRPNRLKDWVRPLLPLALRRRLGAAAKQWNIVADKEPMPEETRRELHALFTPEIVNLQTLTGLDFSHWLEN